MDTKDGAGELAGKRVAIVGLGLMGGSLAMALRGHCRELIGIDPDPETLALAGQKGVVDRLSDRPEQLLAEAQVIVLAAPVRAILKILYQLPAWHPGDPVVLDLGSTKAEIVRAMQALPARFDPLGGHPMCGKERTSLKAADAQLYLGRPFAFTPLERTSARARRLAGQLAAAVGARPVWIDAGAHDRWVAATSHLPYLLASALSAGTPIECAPLVGPGFIGTSRVASTSPDVMLDILITNRSNLLEALSRFLARLDDLERWLESGDWPELLQALAEGAASRAAVLAAADSAADSEAA